MTEIKDHISERQRYFKTGRKTLTEAQANALLNVITDIEHLALFELALSTGIRRSDIVKIKQIDFDAEKRKITFYEQKKRRLHTVFLPQRVANTIEMVIRSNKGETYLFKGSSDKKHNKGHISSKTAYNIFQRYLKKAGLEQRPFHSLRATCIKLCQAKGWKPEETAELVGDSLKVIHEHYTIPSEDEMREVSEKRAVL